MYVTQYIMGYRSFQTCHDTAKEFSLLLVAKKDEKKISKEMKWKRNKGEEFPKRKKNEIYYGTTDKHAMHARVIFWRVGGLLETL